MLRRTLLELVVFPYDPARDKTNSRMKRIGLPLGVESLRYVIDHLTPRTSGIQMLTSPIFNWRQIANALIEDGWVFKCRLVSGIQAPFTGTQFKRPRVSTPRQQQSLAPPTSVADRSLSRNRAKPLPLQYQQHRAQQEVVRRVCNECSFCHCPKETRYLAALRCPSEPL
jgi:hypothetical protein